LKRATRKLSLSGPILGFGKRDKDKDKEREREKEREKEKREKEKGAPSAYLGRF
jgi:ubiquitin carboxyl-terminal hydrolase 9/13